MTAGSTEPLTDESPSVRAGSSAQVHAIARPSTPATLAAAGPPPHSAPQARPVIQLQALERLKQHHIGRVVVLYLGICWVILEPVHVVFGILGIPEWMSRVVVIAMALGFPIVIVTTWVYSVTPAGLPSAALDERRRLLRRMSRRLNRAIAAVAVLLGLYFVLYYFWIGKYVTEPVSDTRTLADTAVVPGAPVPQRSIAVLPFVDLSQTHDQQYLADGLAEELGNLLDQIPELRVAARTSAFAFKNKPEGITTIAKELRVAHVLEGSIRKAGNRVRVTAQLIRADSGYDLWSETYDGTLDDIFKLQDQIAGAVVQALKVKLLGGSLPQRAAPANVDAYNLYLQGKFLAGLHTQDGDTQALDYLQRALRLDQNYEPTWTELSIVYVDLAARGFMPSGDALPQSRNAVQRAIELNPKSARAHVALGYLHMNDDWDWAEADREIRQALALEPGSAGVLHAAGDLDLVLGRTSESVRLFGAALERDPLRASSYSNLGVAYFAAGRLEDAERAFRESIELRPTAGYTHNGLGLVLLWRGELRAALEEMNRETDPIWRLEGLALVYSAMGRREDSQKALAQLIARFQKQAPYVIATVYGYRGEVDQAFSWLDRALADRDATLTSIKSDPLLRKLQGDARYTALLKNAGLPP
jgi:TolB-like protein/Flp pilus assembly protein TadD